MKAIKFLTSYKQKRVYKKLDLTRVKISKKWESYRKQKTTIKKKFKRKSTIKKHTKELLKKAYSKISNDWNVYREKKYTIIYEKKFEELKLFKTKIDKNTRSEYYLSTKKIFDINSVIEDIFKRKNVKYVLIVFFFKHEETGVIKMVSDSFTKEGFNRIKDENLLKLFLQKLSLTDISYLEEYEFLRYSIRVIYYK